MRYPGALCLIAQMGVANNQDSLGINRATFPRAEAERQLSGIVRRQPEAGGWSRWDR